jgi:hypothetical protein
VILLSLACGLTGSAVPEVEHYPQPTLTVEAGEFLKDFCPPNEYGVRACHPQSLPARLGCEQVRDPGDVLGGLEPAYPIKVCLSSPPEVELNEGEYLYNEGCSRPAYVRYLILDRDETRRLGTLEEMRQAYAPITTEEEALSYAVAVTGLGVRYGIDPPRGWRYFVDELQDTHVRRTTEGYLVHLYDYQFCGCGPHTTYAVDVLVTEDGQARETSRVKAFEDPAEDDLCVD